MEQGISPRLGPGLEGLGCPLWFMGEDAGAWNGSARHHWRRITVSGLVGCVHRRMAAIAEYKANGIHLKPGM